MKNIIKENIKELLRKFGLEYNGNRVGRMDSLLSDLKKRGLNCNVIFDIGAHRTDWSRMAGKIFSTAKFCLVEPQIELQSELEAFCREFPESRYILAGAGPEKCQSVLSLWDDLAGSTLIYGMEQSLLESGKQRVIDIITIDELIQDHGSPEIIKLDIQGFELEALKGGSTAFGTTEVFILEASLLAIEASTPEFVEIINFMFDRQYVVYDFPGFLRRPFDGALVQCDICFVKHNSFLRHRKWS